MVIVNFPNPYLGNTMILNKFQPDYSKLMLHHASHHKHDTCTSAAESMAGLPTIKATIGFAFAFQTIGINKVHCVVCRCSCIAPNISSDTNTVSNCSRPHWDSNPGLPRSSRQLRAHVTGGDTDHLYYRDMHNKGKTHKLNSGTSLCCRYA